MIPVKKHKSGGREQRSAANSPGRRDSPRRAPSPRQAGVPGVPVAPRRRSYLARADLLLQLAVAVMPHEVVQGVLALGPLPGRGVCGDHRPLLMPGPRGPAREERRRRSRGPGPRGGGPALPARRAAARACASVAGGRGRRGAGCAGRGRPRQAAAAAAAAGCAERPPPVRGGSGHSAARRGLAPRLPHPRTQRRRSAPARGREGRGPWGHCSRRRDASPQPPAPHGDIAQPSARAADKSRGDAGEKGGDPGAPGRAS